MKKILFTLAVSLLTLGANAQVYVGGSVGVGSTKIAGGNSETTYKLLPEVGYSFNRNWAVGTVVGLGKGTPTMLDANVANATEYFTVQPYARYTFVHSKLINVFIDGGVGFTDYKDAGTAWSIGLKPGVAVNLSKSLSFVTHVGFLGYNSFDPDGSTSSSSAWGLNLDGNNLTFGLYYNF